MFSGFKQSIPSDSSYYEVIDVHCDIRNEGNRIKIFIPNTKLKNRGRILYQHHKERMKLPRWVRQLYKGTARTNTPQNRNVVLQD